MIAALRIRGPVDVKKKVNKTLSDLSLEKRNQVVLLNDNNSVKGMLQKTKDFITFGEISDEMAEKLAERADAEVEHGTTVSLSPPSDGFRATKKQVGQGGSLGERENLDELLSRMV